MPRQKTQKFSEEEKIKDMPQGESAESKESKEESRIEEPKIIVDEAKQI